MRPELTLSIRKKLEHGLAKSEHNFAQKHKNKTYFYGPDLVPIYVLSTINISLVSNVYVCRNKTMCRKQGLEANIKTRVLQRISLGNKH